LENKITYYETVTYYRFLACDANGVASKMLCFNREKHRGA